MRRGVTLEEGTIVAARFVDAGVDLLDISGGLLGDGQEITRQGYSVYLAETVKKVVSVSVVGVGNITEPEYADRIVREGRVDLVAVGRAMLANPNWVVDAARRLQLAI
jgi:2,4-dienoyl-CoA reductase-like NADH-dependent reductase (Old Yellow Enzyme family)